MTERTFEVEVVVTVKLEGDATEARALVDETLQRAWDTDRGRHHVNRNWHFEMLPDGIIKELDEDGLEIEED